MAAKSDIGASRFAGSRALRDAATDGESKQDVEWPTFAWFCALLYGTYFALLFGGAMVGVIDSTDAVGSTMAICFGLGIVAGIVGVILLKRAAQNRANEAYLEWKRNTTMPPPPPQQPAP